MTVWIINPFDNLPMEGNRPQRYWLMARAFVGAGHRVVYWTSDFSHAQKRRRVFVVENPDPAIKVRMVSTRPYPRNICLRRVFSHRALAREWLRLAGAMSERPDVIVASTPPLSLCAAALDFSRRSGALFVADIMDAWPETFYRVAPAFLFAPLRATARRIYHSADAISAVAARYLDLAASYGATSPTHLAYHGIDLQPSNVQPFNLSTFKPFHLAYLGAMSTSYDLETAIDAVAAMPNVSLDLAGSGPKEEALRTRAASCQRIRFHGFLGDVDLRALLAKCDVGLVPMFPDSCVGVPYKLADYAAAGLRVAECLGGETESLVARHHAGLHYEAGNVESLKGCLTSLMAPPDPAYDPAAFAAEFDATRIMDGYVAWVQGLCAAK
ncbi:MAG: glycosyltransferase family 4 protein [Kiritimatiellae bacterium]|nr:glycosyltransferase family 4 protein [Kiritimatiellia bacterium]